MHWGEGGRSRETETKREGGRVIDVFSNLWHKGFEHPTPLVNILNPYTPVGTRFFLINFVTRVYKAGASISPGEPWSGHRFRACVEKNLACVPLSVFGIAFF